MTTHPPASRAPKGEAHVRFEAFLRARGLRLTRERQKVLEAVFARHGHFDAEQLHVGIAAKGRATSRATVYRTLDLLVQAGLVRKTSLGDQHAHYEAARGNDHHDHLICLQCGKVLEFFHQGLEALQNRICSGRDFQPIHHSLQIFGLCATCRDKMDPHVLQNRLAQIHT